jgi:tetratricopeptide (TPR) repeat protein
VTACRSRERRYGGSRTLLAAPAVLLITLGAVAIAAASEKSELLYSRGLVALQEGSYSEALGYFDRAVQADPRDASALFYRGLTRGRLNDYGGAITDLRAAIDLDPRLNEASLELGVALVQSGRYREAIPWLERAQAVDDLEGQASLFLGIARLRIRELSQAQADFERAARREPTLEVAATYYLGVIAYEQSRFSEARSLFEKVAEAQPESEMGREARAFLDVAGRRARPYSLYGALSLEYDSNVALAPGNQTVDVALGVSGQADGRVTLNAGGLYRLLDDSDAKVSLGYDFFQGLQFHLTEFNLMDNRVHVEGLRRWGPVELAGLASYDYYNRDGDSFLSQVNATPQLTYHWDGPAATTLLYRLRWNDYLQQPYTNLLTAIVQNVGFRQFFYLGAPSRYILLGYQYENQDTTNDAGAAYAYGGSQIEAGLGWDFPWALDLQALYLYNRNNYASASAGRVDDEQRGTLVLTKSLTDYLTLGATFYADVDDSTKPEFTYNRYVGAISAEVTY